jgi:hypothetical protein
MLFIAQKRCLIVQTIRWLNVNEHALEHEFDIYVQARSCVKIIHCNSLKTLKTFTCFVYHQHKIILPFDLHCQLYA